MLRGLYSATTALDMASQQQDATAYNLAEMSTAGYRQRQLTFETFDQVLNRGAAPTGEILGARVSGLYHDFRTGPMQNTGQPLDVALGDAEAFFAVQGPNGPLYTRSGTFQLNSLGQLTTQSGYPVLGELGPITIPTGTVNIQIASDGGINADGVPIGIIRRVSFTDKNALTASGPTLYSAPPEAGLQPANGARVLQGYREGSNVNPAEAMVRLMIGARYYESAQRALRTIAESVQLNTRPQG